MPKPDLSIIIPTLNEAEVLPLLLDDLVRQRGVSFELIITDGGSTDTTCQLVNDAFTSGKLSGLCHIGPRGRGKQLNSGALAATSDWLLFLHADSRLVDANQLQSALTFMHSHQQHQASDYSAGRFPLRFDFSEGEASFGLFFYETKARIGRPGCIHGDQGLLLTASFFQKVGPFREDLPVMEDTSMAEVIRDTGQWLLLPGEILTSARRFEVEGLKSRQTLNALMMNFLAIGWLDFFGKAPDLYRHQDRTRALQLSPFFFLIRDLFDDMSFRKRLGVWLATGQYVQSQAWQIGLALDCRKAYRRNVSQEHCNDFWLKWFERWFDPLTNHAAGHALTALLVRFWFAWQLLRKPEDRI